MQYGKGGSNRGLVLALFVSLLLLNSSVGMQYQEGASGEVAGGQEESSKQPETFYTAQLARRAVLMTNVAGVRLSHEHQYSSPSQLCSVECLWLLCQFLLDFTMNNAQRSQGGIVKAASDSQRCTAG